MTLLVTLIAVFLAYNVELHRQRIAWRRRLPRDEEAVEGDDQQTWLRVHRGPTAWP